MIESIIPQNKEDIDFIKNLKNKSFSEIREYITPLLEWTQDMNWPQASLIIDYLSPQSNEIQNELIEILIGDDEQWKYSIILGLILNVKKKPSSEVLVLIKKIAINPTESEKEEELDEIAQQVIDKWVMVQNS